MKDHYRVIIAFRMRDTIHLCIIWRIPKQRHPEKSPLNATFYHICNIHRKTTEKNSAADLFNALHRHSLACCRISLEVLFIVTFQFKSSKQIDLISDESVIIFDEFWHLQEVKERSLPVPSINLIGMKSLPGLWFWSNQHRVVSTFRYFQHRRRVLLIYVGFQK